MGSILEVDKVYKYFGGVKANENISLTVEQGSIVGLIGPVSYTHLRAHET